MSEFKVFADRVRERFADMSNHQLFVVASDRDEIWARYLAAFPEGSDPMYRKRTEHDCSCCRQFIRNVGNVVAIQNGALTSVWDVTTLPFHYHKVAEAMSAYIKSLPIRDVFLVGERRVGTTQNIEAVTAPGSKATSGRVTTITYNHFSVDVPTACVLQRADIATKQGELRTTHDVLVRGFTELTPEAVAMVADLIQSNAIYRGQEHQRAVLEFQKEQQRFFNTPEDGRDLRAWSMVTSPVARFRNTVIGTLVQDLSYGSSLEASVASFEKKVAPENYKRPTKLITQGMIKDAMATINNFPLELPTGEIQAVDLEPALDRRHARFSDVSVNNVLFVDNAVRGQMRGGIMSKLMEEVKPSEFDPEKATVVSIDQFITKIVPKIKSINLYLENNLMRNFVSMTAPVHEELTHVPLFKWGNGFAWSYEGNATDTIKDKVKRAGGMVEGVALRVSLAWSNTDDLDLHVIETTGEEIFFAHKVSRSGGRLDVDMNAGSVVRDPVENVRWQTMPRSGAYQVVVNNYRRRESVDVGFTVEIEAAGQVTSLRCDKSPASGRNTPVATLVVTGRGLETIKPCKGLVMGAVSQEQWGLKTLQLVKVNSIVLSPNYWDNTFERVKTGVPAKELASISAGGTGNKHWFFILEGCKNPAPTRGIYNEFLNSKLEKHSKVFEVLGDKTKCPYVEEQMSGVGFSSTNKDRVTVVAMGPGLNRAYTIVF